MNKVFTLALALSLTLPAVVIGAVPPITGKLEA